jgi:hypothetical protein
VLTPGSHAMPPHPQTGMNGRPLQTHTIAPGHMNFSIVRDHMAFLGGHSNLFGNLAISRQLRGEHVLGRYYWHHYGDFDYCHYNDRWGHHWYGWYYGDDCFWTAYADNLWWYYDDSYARWYFWSHGAWCWEASLEPTVVYEAAPDATDDSAEAQEPSSFADLLPQGAYRSPDGSCLVRVTGDMGNAYLVTERAGRQSLRLLARGATGVKFHASADGEDTEIMLTLEDGRSLVFDASGRRVSFDEPAAD